MGATENFYDLTDIGLKKVFLCNAQHLAIGEKLRTH